MSFIQVEISWNCDVPVKMGNHLASNFVKELPTTLLRAVKRKTRRFNVIPRTEKVMDKIQENPTRAPLYEATRKQVEQLLKENPEKLNELSDKDENLHKNLENVYVKSTGQNTEIFSKARLPDSYGYSVMRTRQPDLRVPEGKYNSTRAEHFLAAHERDPKVYSAETLADVYKVDAEAMKNILEYVKVYSVALPVKKTRPPGALRRMAQDMLPGGLYEEPEFRVLERKVQLAKDKMAKLYSQSSEKREKLMYDMNMFDSLVALKPMVKKVKEDVMEGVTGAKTVDELNEKISSKLIFKPESKDEAADIPKKDDVDDDSLLGKTKEKLVKYGIMESREEIMEQREADKIRAELKKIYINSNESIAEQTTVSSPQTEAEHHFAKQTQRQLENIPLLEGKKKDDEKTLRLESSSDSAEDKNLSDDSKIQHKEKMSDKG